MSIVWILRQTQVGSCVLVLFLASPAKLGYSEDRMKKVERIPGLRKEQGLWVFDSGTPIRPLTIERILRIGRLERDRRALNGGAREVLTGQRRKTEP